MAGPPCSDPKASSLRVTLRATFGERPRTSANVGERQRTSHQLRADFDVSAEPTGEHVAEVDGNRTRRTRIARPSRFEGGGAHQVPGHLRRKCYRFDVSTGLGQTHHL